MNHSSAASKVFATPELITPILLHADLLPFQLLRLCQVNRTFNDVVFNSLPFRKMLFLDAELPETRTDPLGVEWNPLLVKMFPQCKQSYFDLVLRRRGQDTTAYNDEREHFAMRGSICKQCYSNRLDLSALQDEQCYVHLPILETGDVEDFFSLEQWYEHASWRKMYPTRPALPIHVVDATPLAHKLELEPMTMGEMMRSLVVGEVRFSTPEERARMEAEKEKSAKNAVKGVEALFASLV